jgi:hypothetical protein
MEPPNRQISQLDEALQTASNTGDTQRVEQLLMQGADINAKGGVYGSALQAGERLETVRLLFDKGADLEAIARFSMP